MQFIHDLTQLGINQAVISPGSRSTPVTLACIKHPRIKTHVQIDERCAGFFALGLAQQSANPVLLICTSGTAVANWYPAVIEASYSKTPLILLSADRPEELQACGSNQTINQKQMFGQHVRHFQSLEQRELDQLSIWLFCNKVFQKSIHPLPGPVHINLPFAEPLLPETNDIVSTDEQLMLLTQEIIETKPSIPETIPTTDTDPANIEILAKLINRGEGLIICGRDQYSSAFAQQITSLASHMQTPLLLDPLSKLRFGQQAKAHVIYNYDSIFRSQKAQQLKPDWILRFGSFPVSKSLADFLSQLQCDSILIEAHGQKLDPVHRCQHTIQADAAELCQQLHQKIAEKSQGRLLNQLKVMDCTCQQVIDNHIQQPHKELDEAIIIHELLNQIPDDCILFSGNSMPIRDINSFMTGYEYGNKNIELVCNRGASGIDGNLSTFAGHMIHDKNRPAIAMLGDLTFYHDMNGLLKLRELSQQAYNGTVIILNNNGGGIFSYLAQETLADFAPFWLTATDLDFRQAAELYSLKYHPVNNHRQLKQALTESFNHHQVDIIEIHLQSDASVKMHRQFWQHIIQQLDS